jgi:hypothetical protein
VKHEEKRTAHDACNFAIGRSQPALSQRADLRQHIQPAVTAGRSGMVAPPYAARAASPARSDLRSALGWLHIVGLRREPARDSASFKLAGAIRDVVASTLGGWVDG